ncbi:MAG: ABC transporter ATP-binding protein [Candidatus Brennerbacteria bacterium]|nr:ABC transporter ATP-binding protein [Candidatus Brennerbacteria bacterium]
MNLKLIFKYYWPQLKKYRMSVPLVFLSYALAVAGSGVAAPLLYKRIIDSVSTAGNPAAVSGVLINAVLLLGLVMLFYNLFYRIGDYAISYSQSKALKDIADDAFRRIVRHSYEFFSNTFTGSLVAKVRRYVRGFEEIYDRVVFDVWMNGLRLVFGFVVLTYFSKVLGAILLAWFFLYIGLTAFFVKKKFRKDLLEAEANSRTTAVLADVITNVLNVKMFASRNREFSHFAKTTGVEEKRRRDVWYFQSFQFMFQGYFIAVFEFAGMFAAVWLWLRGQISAGTILLMQIYIFTSFDVVWNIGRNFARFMRALAEAKEMVDIFETPVAVSDPETPEKCRINKGDIEIKRISFAYGKGANKVFRDFSLHIRAGEKVGLVGPSGAGKSTITKLLLRFADVQKGEVLIDGQSIARMSQDDLRSRIAYVPQDPVLFHRTLMENIRYARPKATDEEVVRAAKLAHAHEFISSFPKGYDTLVGERGIKLSGGERQRVAIARAILKDAPILLLDEATSSLDSESEMYIQDALSELMKNRTTIVIAHRLSTIMQMDRIVVIEEGKIIEEGKHKELLKARQGRYQRLWEIQAGGFATA